MTSAPASTCCRGVAGEHGDELLHQQGPGGSQWAFPLPAVSGWGAGVHEALGLDVVAGAAALDHVAGEGEGRSAEADDAELIWTAVRTLGGEGC